MSATDSFIGYLKARREALGWSVKEAGERCGLDYKLLEQWESGVGSPRLDAVDRWAAALGLKLSLNPTEEASRRGLHVDWQSRRITVDGTPVRLTPMEWKALERLAAVPGELVPHHELFRHLYGEDRSYRAESTAIRVLITKLRRLLPLRIEAQWGRGYVISGIAPSTPGMPSGPAGHEDDGDADPETEDKPTQGVAAAPSAIVVDRAAMRRKFVEITHDVRRVTAPPVRPNPGRAEELSVIERFLAERGVTRCPDVATIQNAPLPTLVWDKIKRKWVRPPMPAREAS